MEVKVLHYGNDYPHYDLDHRRVPRIDMMEMLVADLLGSHHIEYYYEAVRYPHGWDQYGYVIESSNPDFHLPSTADRPAIEIETTIVGCPHMRYISNGYYNPNRARAALKRKRRQAGRRLYYYGVNTLIIDYPLGLWLERHPDDLPRLIERTARRLVVMMHTPQQQRATLLAA